MLFQKPDHSRISKSGDMRWWRSRWWVEGLIGCYHSKEQTQRQNSLEDSPCSFKPSCISTESNMWPHWTGACFALSYPPLLPPSHPFGWVGVVRHSANDMTVLTLCNTAMINQCVNAGRKTLRAGGKGMIWLKIKGRHTGWWGEKIVDYWLKEINVMQLLIIIFYCFDCLLPGAQADILFSHDGRKSEYG